MKVEGPDGKDEGPPEPPGKGDVGKEGKESSLVDFA
jgi:hypothetical protein